MLILLGREGDFMKIKRAIQLTTIIGLLLTLILPFLAMEYDTYITGDEVITYSMANNDKGGFVFSKGRVASYIENEIFDETFSDTIINFKNFVIDILRNKKSALFFQYEREPEVAVYSNSEIKDWFSKRKDERFNIGTTWIHSLSDDANSYLYYCLLNFVSSLFIGISGTKWVGFILNYLFFVFCLLEIFRLSRTIGMSEMKSIVACVIWGTSVVTVTTVTYIRAYICATAFALLLIQLYVNLFKKIKNDIHYRFGKDLIWIIVVYVFSYITHYTNAIVLGSLAFVLLLFLIKKRLKIKRIVLYCFGTVATIGLGIAADPTSVVGLASKFLAASGSNISSGEKVLSAWRYLSGTIFPNAVICVLVFLAIIYSIIRYLQKNSNNSEYLYLVFSTVVFWVVVIIGTGRLDYGRVIMPVLAILFVNVVENVVKDLINKKGIDVVCCTLIAIVVVTCGICGGRASLAIMNNLQAEVDDALENYSGYNCLYFRHHGNGYQDAVNLRNMSSVQIVTIDTKDWKEFIDRNFTDADKILIFFTENTYSEETMNWVIDLGYSIQGCVYNGESTQIYIVER